MTVDVFNDAGVAGPVLKSAELEAERIFDPALKDNRQVPPKKVTQRFICDIGYSQEKCDQQMSILRKALTKYSVSQPDNWTWVLVLSDRWKPILRQRRVNPNTPAFTYLDKRQTFVEEAIVVSEGAIERRTELLKDWRVPLDQLLDLAVTHELGHAICHEPDEGKADRYGRTLREGKPLVCDKQKLN